MFSIFGRGKNNQPEPVQSDVTLHVPGMYWKVGWPDRVRDALGTLPWVEHESILTVVKTRQVHFDLKEGQAFDETAVRDALKNKRFPEVTVKSIPPSQDTGS